MVAPRADLMKRGVPPTPRNARTGEFTPPGMSSIALVNSSSDRMCCRIANQPQITHSLRNLWLDLQSGDSLLGLDSDRFEAREAHEAGGGAFGFRQKLSRCVVDDDFRV